ncbi:AI-2E family transporter [Aeromicrobium sp. SMF47]|uniref:AI-2E family transporter n=1 Tax=Aeromicrobium yanjiei TaxID=2662028 RepID=A0A5Q2MJD5_9ACTN|nr:MULTISPECIES: AI-2E family transporter [Aeromicrobium]MRJ75091.1 AI-2E family transporter [Aeromicrobium yanjiei]MRK02853.1 AI-2E family transporter [Aeromicrobium sp. S22]QGG40425.1 AI-2E family transporter [Aeromicrobium yanjiei]
MAENQRIRDRGVVIDEGFGNLQRWGLRIIVIAAAAYVIGWGIGHVWIVLFPVSMALIVSTVLGPPVAFLRSKGWPSALAAALVVVSFIAALMGVIAVLTPQVAGQAGEIASNATDGLQKVRDWVTGEPLNLSDGQISRAIEAVQEKLQSSATAISSGVFSTLSTATSIIVNIILVLMLTFFFVKDGHKFLPWLNALGGQRTGAHLSEVLGRVWATLGGFIRTQTLVALIDAIIIGGGLWILGSPLAVPLAVITFFGGYIPIVGAFVSGALAVLVTIVTNDFKAALIALVIVVAVQQLEGNVLSPLLQGKNMNLHPAVVLMSVTAGGSMFGITGAFLAVPVAASVAEILRYVNERIDDSVSVLAPKEDARAAEPSRDD